MKIKRLQALTRIVNSPLVERFVRESSTYHSTAKARGLTLNDSHYKITQNWQAIAKKILCHADVLSVFPDQTEVFVEHTESDSVKLSVGIPLPVPADNPDTVAEENKEVITEINEYIHTWHQVGEAVPFHWTEQTLDMAMKMPLPSHTIGKELMMLPNMIFIFENPIYFSEGSKRRFLTWVAVSLDKIEEGRPMYEKGCTQHEMSINYTIDNRDLNYHREYVNTEGKCFEMHAHEGEDCKFPKYRLLRPRSEEEDYLEYAWIKLGGEYPTEYEDGDYRGPPELREMNQFLTDLVIRLLTFINTTAVEIERKGLPRSIRRDKSINKSTSHSYVNVIKLRRVKYKGEYVPIGDGTSKTVQFKGAGWVTGHYKSQPYGLGNTLRKIIYIDPYIRGKGIQNTQLYKVAR
jgi:hypothetical protein